MFSRLSNASWVTIAVLFVLAILATYGDFVAEQTIARLRMGGIHTTATVVGSTYYKFRPMTSIVEYTTLSGEIISSELIVGQLVADSTVSVFYDPQDPTIVTLASGGRRHYHLVLTFALMVTALFVLVIGIENFPRRY